MTTSEKTIRIHRAILKNRRAARAALVAMLRKKGRNQGRAAVALEASVARRDKLDKDLYIQLKFVHVEIRRLEERCTALEDRDWLRELVEEKKAVIESNADTMREIEEVDTYDGGSSGFDYFIPPIESNTYSKLELEEEDTYDGGSSGFDHFTPPGPSPLRYQLDQVDDTICHEECWGTIRREI
jgi:hypothetical protein